MRKGWPGLIFENCGPFSEIEMAGEAVPAKVHLN